MNTVIIEDEFIAAQTLQNALHKINPSIKMLAVLQSIEESVEWFSCNKSPDLVFMDIHIADGSCFAIFEKATIACPVIFTTAYDEYALKAFEVNSIDYLLKPIEQKKLERSLNKFKMLSSKQWQFDSDSLAELVASIKTDKSYNSKSNLLIPHKDKLIPLSVDKIAFIYFENKMSNIYTFDGEKYYLDISLDEFCRQLDDEKFFRANRQYIIAHKAIKDVSLWFTSKLSVNLTVVVPEKIIISKERAPKFKEWLTI
ncbi:MAG: LytTR family DNA-binding domain-containing protein [Bacteroidales bacterium]|jgi:two-component system LytT family response regulator|nr:LytTR family DNA-binding domain-containing protein [Bacteroidales bacterium]